MISRLQWIRFALTVTHIGVLLCREYNMHDRAELLDAQAKYYQHTSFSLMTSRCSWDGKKERKLTGKARNKVLFSWWKILDLDIVVFCLYLIIII